MRSWLAGVATVVLCVGVVCIQPLVSRHAGGLQVRAADADRQWYRGNLHTHSLWSDGDDYPEMIALWYREHAYDFLCFTDHNVLLRAKDRWSDIAKNKGGEVAFEKLKARFPEGWVDERMVEDRHEVRLKTFDEIVERIGESGKFLLIQGEEISDKFGKLPLHMNATNIQEPLPPLGGDSVYDVLQNNTNAVMSQRKRTGQPIFVHTNHPNFGYGIAAEDLMRVRGENFFEVYNGHPGVNNDGNAEHASTERIWDIMLTRRLAELGLPVMYGLATDDGHNYHKIPSRGAEPGRGWIMVLASRLAPGELIDALERGDFYACSGVRLKSIETDTKGMRIEVAAEPEVTYTIDFIGTRRGFDPTSTPVLDKEGKEIYTTRRYSSDIGKVLKTVTGNKADYTFTGDELYVRARVTSSKKHPNPSVPGEFERAWAQPLRGPAAPATP
jgi:hypothetical protein